MPHDAPRIVLIGASAGGLQAVREVLGGLTPGLPAAVVVVMHLGQGSFEGHLYTLGQAGPLPVSFVPPEGGIAPGHVYLAPAKRHLVFRNGRLHALAGPRVNRFRPSIDVAFRSAAVTYGHRVVGVVLSGLLDDGTAGLQAIKRCGGLAVVQEPADAEHGDMPASALRYVDADHVAPAAALGGLLSRLVAAPPPDAVPIPDALLLEARLDARTVSDLGDLDRLGARAAVSCPACGGPMWRLGDAPPRFRCHVGHGHTLRSLLREQDEALEQTLWAAYRMLEERARTLDRLQGEAAGRTHVGADYAARCREAHAHAERLRNLLLALELGANR
jgi:two-component system chemotaxis response regulator CheB